MTFVIHVRLRFATDGRPSRGPSFAPVEPATDMVLDLEDGERKDDGDDENSRQCAAEEHGLGTQPATSAMSGQEP